MPTASSRVGWRRRDRPVTLAPPPQADFSVHLDVFQGPFDLLLGLIAKHQLDITEISLSTVTDEYITHVKELGPDLERTTQFLVVAATLLDLKTARLLPQADVEDEDDLALLEARDLLFARLLQYRAFKRIAEVLDQRLADESRRHPRIAELDERFARLLPEVVVAVGVEEFASLAATVLAPKPVPTVSLTHLHAPQVSVREQASLVVIRLRRSGSTTFRTLVSDAPDTLTTVARFLALLELFREGAVGFEQISPLGDLYVRWTGGDQDEVDVSDEFDEGALP
ncbi:MAG: segregation/condensation protein A [Nocardioidaceae bacterium]|nr:segregation/condensation protein A [Nocardioidaceae bacterium]